MKLNRQNKLLIFGFAVMLYLCYTFAFSNTVDYYNRYTSQRELVASNVNDPAVTRLLIQKEKQVDNVLKQYASHGSASFQNELLKELSYLSNTYSLKITDFKEPHTIVKDDVKTFSYAFTLEGSFNGILLLLNKVENNASLGYMKHIAFVKKRNYKTNTDYLTAEVILQKNETIK